MNRILTANNLRETLGYSMRFDGKIICIVIDAEPFESYDYAQLSQDLILLEKSCDAKIIVAIGCFPSRSRPKKKEENLHRISHASNEFFKNIADAGNSVMRVKLSDSLLVNSLTVILEEHSIVIVELEDAHNADSEDVWSVLFAVKKYLGKSLISKLIIMSSHDGVFGDGHQFLAQIHSEEIKELINKEIITGELAVVARTAVRAIDELEIERVHLVNGTKPDSLLVELFTKDGSGTMIYSGEYIDIRLATPSDFGGINSLKSRHIGNNFQYVDAENFLVAVIDDYVVACCHLQLFPEEEMSLLTALAVNSDYVEIGKKLLEKAVDISREKKLSAIFLAISQVVPWWMPSDFADCDGVQIPKELEKYTGKKSVTLLVKKLS